MGDSIDNIKGVPGIGEKGARDLIAEHGNLDTLLAHAASVSNKRYREGLLAHADDARQSRELARIRTDVPVEFQPETLRFRGASRERCFELFTRLGFRTLVMEYAPTADTIGKDYAVIASLDELDALVATAARRRPIRLARDSGCAVRHARGHRRLVAVGGAPNRALHSRVIARACTASREGLFGAPDGGLFETRDEPAAPTLELSIVLDRLRPLLEDASVAKIGHDLKFDAIVLARHGVTLRGLDTDTMLVELPAERDPLVTSARRTFARAWRLQGADRRGRLRPGRQGRVAS